MQIKKFNMYEKGLVVDYFISLHLRALIGRLFKCFGWK